MIHRGSFVRDVVPFLLLAGVVACGGGGGGPGPADGAPVDGMPLPDGPGSVDAAAPIDGAPDAAPTNACTVGAANIVATPTQVPGRTDLVVAAGDRFLAYPGFYNPPPATLGRVVRLGSDGAPLGSATTLTDFGRLLDASPGTTGVVAALTSQYPDGPLAVVWVDGSGAVTRTETIAGEISREHPAVTTVGDVTYVAWVRDDFTWATAADAVYWAAFGPGGTIVTARPIDVPVKFDGAIELVPLADRALLVVSGRTPSGAGSVSWYELAADGSTSAPVALAAADPAAAFDAVLTSSGDLGLAWTKILSFSPYQTDVVVTVADRATGAVLAHTAYDDGGVNHAEPTLLAAPGGGLRLALLIPGALELEPRVLELHELAPDLSLTRRTVVAPSVRGLAAGLAEDGAGFLLSYTDLADDVKVVRLTCP